MAIGERSEQAWLTGAAASTASAAAAAARNKRPGSKGLRLPKGTSVGSKIAQWVASLSAKVDHTLHDQF